MLSRSIARRALRLNARSSAGSLSRNYSVVASARVSPVMLGKRPVKPLSAVPVRDFSWTPWRSPDSSPATAAPDSVPGTPTVDTAPTPTGAVGSTPSHEPIFVESSTASSTASSAPPSDALSSTLSTPSADPASHAVDAAFPATGTDLADAAAAVDPALLHANGQTLGELVVNIPHPLEEILQSPAAIEAVCTKADLSLIGLSHSWYSFPGWAIDGMVALHNMTGAPWWATIGMMTVLIRMCLFPVFLRAHGNNARFQAIQPEFQELLKKVQDAKKRGDKIDETQYMVSVQQLLKDNNTNPLKALLLPISQLPVFLTMFAAVRRLAETPLPQFKDGGLGWFTDLTATDPTYILPITSLVLTNIVLRMGADGMAAASNSENGRHMINGFTLFSVFGAVIASRFPSAMLVYWTCTSALTLAQAILMRQAWFKRVFNIHDPVRKPPPPGAKPLGDITMADSLRAAKAKLMDTFEQAKTQQALAISKAEAEERRKHKREGTSLMVSEKIKGVPKSQGATEDSGPPAPTGRDLLRSRGAASARRGTPSRDAASGFLETPRKR